MAEFNRRQLVGAGAAATLLGVSPLRAHHKPKGAWAALENMPFKVQEIYPAPFWRNVSDSLASRPKSFNVIVNAGGLTPDKPYQVTDEVVYYDPKYDAWGYAQPLPSPRHHLNLVNNNGYLYAIGGFARDEYGGWQMRGDCWRVSSLDEFWLDFSPLPEPQAESVCVSNAGFIHVIGGRTPAGTLNAEWNDHIDTDDHWVYDAADDRWYDLRPMPTPRNSAASAVVNGVIYVIGGRTVRGGGTDAVEVYDALADRWSALRPMPKNQGGGVAAGVIDGKIYVFGGEYFDPRPGGVYAEVWEYDPLQDEWREVTKMTRPRHGLGAVSLGGSIYVMGGGAAAGGAGTSAALDRFDI
ncbi:MAG: kelch repeat-containing protein [Pseudomonadota bacterium]